MYWNSPDGFSEQRVTRLPTVGPHALAFAQPRNQIDNSEQEYYISEPYRLPDGAIVQRLDWEVEHAPSTWVRAQIRTAATPEQLDAEPWRGGREAGGRENDEWLGRRQPLQAGASRGRWMQYRLALGAANGGCTPRVREVRVEYGARQP